MTSSLESYVVTKGGITMLFGSFEKGIKWGNIVMDHLLCKFIQSPRYDIIICLLRDRSMIEILQSIQISKNEKLIFIVMDKPFDVIMNSINEELLRIFSGISILIYSFSDLILSYGYIESKSFVNNLYSILSTKNSNVISLVCLIHQTLHSPLTLSRIQSFANINVVILPNNGTLSEEIACEIHSIRRSNVTNKVVEDIEMFKVNNHNSTPYSHIIPIIKKFNNQTINIEQTEMKQDDLSINSNTSTRVDDNNKNDGILKQLVTFDSTDPEFDDDENPDDDLDL